MKNGSLVCVDLSPFNDKTKMSSKSYDLPTSLSNLWTSTLASNYNFGKYSIDPTLNFS